jgi:hypothetical protein
MSDWSDESAALFEADRGAPGPSPEARARVCAGVMASVAAGAGTSGAMAKGAGAAKAGALTAGAGLALKVGVPLVLLAAIGATAAVVARRGAAHEGPQRTGAPTLAVPGEAPREPRFDFPAHEPEALPSPSAAPAPAPVRAAPSSRSPAAPRATPTAAASADTLQAELGQVNAIEDALRHGDPGGARGLADDYLANNPRGALREEVTGARAVALCTQERSDDAVAAGAAFVKAHPASLLVPRIRAACGSAIDSVTDPSPGGQ